MKTYDNNTTFKINQKVEKKAEYNILKSRWKKNT